MELYLIVFEGVEILEMAVSGVSQYYDKFPIKIIL
jgi:hypothetical protein